MSNNNTLANKTRPKKFKDYICADNTGVELIKCLIKDNLHSNLNKINDFSITVLLIEGPSGTGKTSLSNLYARATLCPNRPQGEYEPCGECDVCNGIDNSNIYEYTIKSSTEARDVIQGLIAQSYCSPIKTTGREDQFRQFIILDELENATPELISSYLLKPLEDNPNTTSWILSTMDLEKLERRNPIVKEAITSRSTIISLQKFTSEQIAETLERKAGVCNEVGLLIGKVCNGNLREAWKELAKISIVSNLPLNKITSLEVTNLLLGGMTIESKREFWQALKNKNHLLVKSILSKWSSKTSQKVISNILIEDLLSDYISYSYTPFLLNSLISWYNSTITYDLSLVFLEYLGKEFKEKKENNKENKMNNKENKMNNEKNLDLKLIDLAQKRGKKLNEEVITPFYIKEKSIKEVLKYYR